MTDPRQSTPIQPCPKPDCQCRRDDDVKWLAITVRRGLLVIVRAIEDRYQIEEKKRAA